MLRRRRATPAAAPSRPDPDRLNPALRAPVRAAYAAADQFATLVAGMADGPLRTRLASMTPRIEAGVQAVWETAERADRIDRHVATLDPERATAELKAARRAGADRAVVEARAARFASVQRLLNARDQAIERLPLAEARLDAAVARAAEIALVGVSGDAALSQLDAELGDALLDLEALAAALSALPA